jgi:hypothetical protein
VIVATSLGIANPPLVNGQPPGGGITYGPLQYAAAGAIGVAVVSTVTTRALYVGSLVSGVAAAFDREGAPLINRGGTEFMHPCDEDGRFSASRGWTRHGRFYWQSVTQVRLTGGACGVVDGTPFNRGPTYTDTWDITTNLAAGEAEAPSTWYYAYLRKRVSERTAGAPGPFRSPERNLVPILSAEAPLTYGGKPTPEVGFMPGEYLYVGSVFNDAASNLVEFAREGNSYIYLNAIFGVVNPAPADVAVNPARTALTMAVPATSRLARVMLIFRLVGAGVAEDIMFQIWHQVGRVNQSFVQAVQAGAGETRTRHTHELMLILDAAKQFEINRDAFAGAASFQLTPICTGYVEDLEGLA